jgi:hypothetical protein
MLLGGKGGCQQCTCVPCDPCTRTCTNPHTGTAFEAVYTRYFEGAEDGNTTDGYLTASGDSDTSDPYDGMDGNGPWFQQVAGTFTLEPSTTRHPCRVTVSFWRNNYVLGAATIPPPATTTTMNRIRVIVSASSETGVFVEGTYVAIGDTLDLNVTIPLVTGGGDQSTNDPRTYNGSATVTPECHNKTAIFTVEARLEWNVKKRQHVVYGLVRECYEDENPCLTFCSGDPANDVLYLTISNVRDTNGNPFITFFEGTYAVDRTPQTCQQYFSPTPYPCHFTSYVDEILIDPLYILFGGGDGQTCYQLLKVSHGLNLCNSGVLGTGTGTVLSVDGTSYNYGSFEWKIES